MFIFEVQCHILLSRLYVKFLNDWIEKDFKKWFVYKILIDESIEEEDL